MKDSNLREDLDGPLFFLDSLIEHLPNMIFVKDARELRFVRFNRAGEELLGVERSGLIGKNDYDLFPREQAEFFVSNDRKVLEGGVLVDIPEEPITTRQGLRFLHTRKIPLKNRDGEIEYLLGISEDITARKAAELELAKSQEALRASHAELERRVLERTMQLKDAVTARDEFISIASHELKTPLTPLKLQIQSLILSIKGNPQAQLSNTSVEKLLRTSDRQINRLNNLIEALLDVSRISAGHLQLHREKVDLSEILRETVERHQEQLNQAHSSSEIDAPTPVQGLFDRLRIEQVISNLLNNASKYAPGCPVGLRVAIANSQAILTVQDQGAGIPEEQLPRLFNRFERGTSHSSNLGGLGLGLYISRKIIEAHGGTIRAENSDMRGAKFTITLPLESG